MQPEPPALFAVHLVAAAAAPLPPGPLEMLITYLPMAMIVLVAWLLLYRPERERARRHQDLLSGLKKTTASSRRPASMAPWQMSIARPIA